MRSSTSTTLSPGANGTEAHHRLVRRVLGDVRSGGDEHARQLTRLADHHERDLERQRDGRAEEKPPGVEARDVRRAVFALRPVPLDEEVDDELEHRRVLGDAGDVVEGRDVVRGVLRAVPRQGLGDPLDLVVGLVEAEVLRPEGDDGGERHLAAKLRVPFAEVVVVGGVGVAAVFVGPARGSVGGVYAGNLAPLPKRGERRGMMGKDRQSVGRSRSSRTDREGRAREGSARTPREKRAGFDARDGVWPVRATARPSACLPTDGEARSRRGAFSPARRPARRTWVGPGGPWSARSAWRAARDTGTGAGGARGRGSPRSRLRGLRCRADASGGGGHPIDSSTPRLFAARPVEVARSATTAGGGD